MDRELCLHWCMSTFDYAVSYYRRITGEHATYSTMTRNLSSGHVLRALLFGAVRAEGTITSAEVFDEIWDTDRTAEYVSAIYDGLMNFLPAPPPNPELTDFDLQWPDTVERGKDEKKEMDFSGLIVRMKREGYSLAEIGQMTARGAHEYLEIIDGRATDTDWVNEDGAI